MRNFILISRSSCKSSLFSEDMCTYFDAEARSQTKHKSYTARGTPIVWENIQLGYWIEWLTIFLYNFNQYTGTKPIFSFLPRVPPLLLLPTEILIWRSTEDVTLFCLFRLSVTEGLNLLYSSTLLLVVHIRVNINHTCNSLPRTHWQRISFIDLHLRIIRHMQKKRSLSMSKFVFGKKPAGLTLKPLWSCTMYV